MRFSVSPVSADVTRKQLTLVVFEICEDGLGTKILRLTDTLVCVEEHLTLDMNDDLRR